jgi:hypothetical protein
MSPQTTGVTELPFRLQGEIEGDEGRQLSAADLACIGYVRCHQIRA